MSQRVSAFVHRLATWYMRLPSGDGGYIRLPSGDGGYMRPPSGDGGYLDAMLN